MTVALAQRLIALAGIALLAILLALSLRPGTSHGRHLPRAIPAPGGGWNRNLMVPGSIAFFRPSRTCGVAAGPRSLGLSSSVYPCRTKIWLRYRGMVVLTQVISLNAPLAGSAFAVSPALARKLGLTTTQEIKWRLAARS